MELESILQFIQNKNILVTGATGFLAKSITQIKLNPLSVSLSLYLSLSLSAVFFLSLFVVVVVVSISYVCAWMDAVFVEKILRVQPNVKKLYLLLRAADTKSATQRLHNEVYM